MEVQYVYQEIDALPAGFKAPAGRTKPWGTGHAVLVAREAVRRPFAAINADDFYGAGGYRSLAGHFARSDHYAMVGYPLKQTLSEHGTVSRGLCTTDAAGRLQRITEITKIEKSAHGARYTDPAGAGHGLTGDEIVSMNFWGLRPAVFSQLEAQFRDFLQKKSGDLKAEFYLPTTLSALNERHETAIDLLPSDDAWFGITCREDMPTAQSAIQALNAAGRYPTPLWG